MFFDDLRLNWLVFEGILPLIGAGILYIMWGICRYIASNNTNFTYAWSQALDPFGWLYGAVILAFQSGFKTLSYGNNSLTLSVSCFLAGIVCSLLLMSAMTERGQSPNWHPPKSLQFFSILLVMVILYTGFQVQNLTIIGGEK